MIFVHRFANVTNHQNDLIGRVLPAPDSLMVGIVGLDERMVAHSESPKIPIILGGPPRQRLHLQENHALVTGWVASNNCLVKIDVCWNVVFRKFPFTIAATEVDGKSASIGNTERARDVQVECTTGRSSPASNMVMLGGRRLGLYTRRR